MREFINIRELVNPAHEDINSYAATCLLSREEAAASDELRKFSAELMSAVSRACFVYGAKDIGHIKAYIEHDTGFLYADTLGDPADVKVEGRDGEPAKRFKLVINSVIYGLSGETVKKATEVALESQLLKFGFARDTETNNRK